MDQTDAPEPTDGGDLNNRSSQALRALAEELPGVHPRIVAARRENALEELSSVVLDAWLHELGDDAVRRLRTLLATAPSTAEVRAFVERELDDHVRTAREALARRRPAP